MFNLRKKAFKKFDFVLLITVLALCIYGIVIIYSAALSLENLRFVKTQSIATIIGLVAVIIIIFFDLQFLGKLYLPIYIICVGLLLAVLFFGVGEEQWGARSWLYIGRFGFQPAEFVKVGLIISLAKFIDKNKHDINSPFVLLKILAFAFFPVVLILLQPDAGTAMVFVFFILAMLFAAGIKWKYIASAFALGLMSLPLIWFRLDAYQKDRIYNFLDPERDTSNTGLQALQGRIAIGSGKFFGRGLFQGTQTQYNFIPEKQTDFIFAVLVEELGFLGGALLIMLYFVMLYRIVIIGKNCDDKFGSLMCIGFAGMFLIHIWQNIGMTIGLMPITGIPLPFMSYGGTFQLINLIAIGIVLNVALHREGLYFE